MRARRRRPSCVFSFLCDFVSFALCLSFFSLALAPSKRTFSEKKRKRKASLFLQRENDRSNLLRLSTLSYDSKGSLESGQLRSPWEEEEEEEKRREIASKVPVLWEDGGIASHLLFKSSSSQGGSCGLEAEKSGGVEEFSLLVYIHHNMTTELAIHDSSLPFVLQFKFSFLLFSFLWCLLLLLFSLSQVGGSVRTLMTSRSRAILLEGTDCPSPSFLTQTQSCQSLGFTCGTPYACMHIFISIFISRYS